MYINIRGMRLQGLGREVLFQGPGCKLSECLVGYAQHIFQIILYEHRQDVPSYSLHATGPDEMRHCSQLARRSYFQCYN